MNAMAWMNSMNHETLIENIKTKLPHIAPALLNSIWEIVEHTERRADSPTSANVPLKFIGDNLVLDASIWGGNETNKRSYARSEVSKRSFDSMKLWPSHS